jgi:hypothetical protein
VLDVLRQYQFQVAWPGDQEVVEALPAQGADRAFRDGVCAWCPRGGVRLMQLITTG